MSRLHALDATRALALLLGVVLHATMSFFLGFPAQDASAPSTTLAVSFYGIHLFRMSVFFVLAGFFAHLLMQRRGLRGFVRDRGKRIVVPMTVGWLLLAPLTIAIVIWGMARSYPELPAEVAEAVVADRGFPLIHLWFLYYLVVFYAAAVLLRAVAASSPLRDGQFGARLDRLSAFALRTRLAPLLLAVPTFWILYRDPNWALWFGIPTPDHGLMPQVPATIAYGSAFLVGWLLGRQHGLLDVLRRQWAGNLVHAIGLTLLCLWIIGPLPDLAAPTVLDGPSWLRAVYAGAYALAIWCWSFGLIGAALRYFDRASAWRRYLADASYWIYLVHLPLVFALQVLLMALPLHWSLKFPLIVGASMAVLLLSYHVLVRSTVLGEMLNGRRLPRRTGQGVQGPNDATAQPASALAAVPAADSEAGASVVVAELRQVGKRYGKQTAQDQLDLCVRSGEVLALLGPNGAGKSTTIGLWLGLLQPDRGEATLLGGSPLDVHSRLGVGVMMQDVALAATLRVRELLRLTTSYYRNPRPVDEVLQLAGIEALAGRPYGRLSVGQKRQVQFALAICGRPALLFLDEPTVGLDVQAREAVWRSVRRLRAEGCAIVLTTHYLEEAEALADRVAVLHRGQRIAEGSVEQIRSLVAHSRIQCLSTLAVNEVRAWPGVLDAERRDQHLHLTTADPEAVVRRLLQADPRLSRLQVQPAGLAEAFQELTREAA